MNIFLVDSLFWIHCSGFTVHAEKACIPVIALPSIKAWISFVPATNGIKQ